MTPRSLFTIILKVIGLLFLKEIVNSLIQVIYSAINLYNEYKDSGTEGFLLFFFSFISFALFGAVSFFTLFKTDLIIDKLKLDKHFEEEKFAFDISISSVLTIALVFIGGFMLLGEIPSLFQRIFYYIQERKLAGPGARTDLSPFFFSVIKIILALLIIGERKRIVSFTEMRKNTDEGVDLS